MATGKGYKKRERERLRALSRRSKDEEDDGGRSRDTRQEEGMRFIRLWALQLSVINVSFVARMPLWSNDGGWFLSATMEGAGGALHCLQITRVACETALYRPLIIFETLSICYSPRLLTHNNLCTAPAQLNEINDFFFSWKKKIPLSGKIWIFIIQR